MAIDLTEIKDIYDDFLVKGMEELKKLQTETQMEDEHLATAASSIIAGAMENSIRALQTIKQSLLLDEQIETEKAKTADVISTTTVREAQHEKDMLIKDQQELAERIKNGGLYYAYTYDANGVVLTKTLQAGTTKSIYEYQADKMLADTNFVKEQKLQLGYSVTYNNRLKVAENYGDMIGNLGLGGLNISSAMWTTYFAMLNDVYTNYGDTPVVKTISVPASTALVLTKIA